MHMAKSFPFWPHHDIKRQVLLERNSAQSSSCLLLGTQRPIRLAPLSRSLSTSRPRRTMYWGSSLRRVLIIPSLEVNLCSPARIFLRSDFRRPTGVLRLVKVESAFRDVLALWLRCCEVSEDGINVTRSCGWASTGSVSSVASGCVCSRHSCVKGSFRSIGRRYLHHF